MEGVVIVTIPTCSQCKLLKKILEKYQVDYREISHGEEYLEEYPVIFYDGKEMDYNSFMKEYKEQMKK